MSWTKRQLIENAYEEIGYAPYIYDLTPEQLRSGLRRLDSMIGTWIKKNINLGYPLTSQPQDSDLDTPSNIPATDNEAVYTNLSIRLSPPVGKTISIETRQAAIASYNLLLSVAAKPVEMQMPGSMPAGAGNRTYNGTNDAFLIRPDKSPVRLSDNGQLDFTE